LNTSTYSEAIAGEGAFWDDFTSQRLRRGEIPGSIDWRLTFTQFRYNHGWRPLCLGAQGINFRLPEIRYVLTTAASRPGMRVLDLGCGAGWLSLELARRGAHVTALDISETNLALARYMAETNSRNFSFLYQGFAGLPCRLEEFGSVEYAYADLNEVSLPAGEYDAVVVWDSLHHVRDLERLLGEIRRALKPGGVFVGVDHSYATTRTETFNRATLPLLDDFYAWVLRDDPHWLYDLVNKQGAERNWGIPPVDYDPTPVSGFAPFLDTLLAEMREIVEGAAVGRGQVAGLQAKGEIESPFEDVSAERLMHVLLEEFRVREFRTLSPFVQPERHIPHYRHEAERIFQHYLSSALMSVGERAIVHRQADGQWFLFNLSPERPTGDGNREMLPEQPATLDQLQMMPDKDADSRQTYVAGLEALLKEWRGKLDEQSAYIFHQMGVIDERLAYIQRLEGELGRKEAAMTVLEERIHLLEHDLVAARAPRLPWKRRKKAPGV
jgi:ubiquinone/menaquinone biosynthesis C-methylase UbiE